MNLDDDLRRALKRQPPPADLTDRVLARIARGDVAARQAKEEGGRQRTWPLRWLAAAAALTLVAAGGVRYYSYQQTVAEAARVKAQIRLALEITSEKIAMVQVRLNPDATYERSGRNP
jgi:hypothetical protein